MEPDSIVFQDDGLIPNSRLAVLLYRAAMASKAGRCLHSGSSPSRLQAAGFRRRCVARTSSLGKVQPPLLWDHLNDF